MVTYETLSFFFLSSNVAWMMVQFAQRSPVSADYLWCPVGNKTQYKHSVKLASVSLAARLSNNTFINLISSESAFPTSQVRLLFTVLPKRLEKKKKTKKKQALATGGGFETVACELGDSFGKD